MTTVISVPPSLDEQSVEQVFEQLALVPDGAKILVDARHARWASPYGLTALLCVAQSRADRMGFAVPEHTDTVSYWSRAGFFRHAAELYDLHGTVPRAREAHESDVLLEITPITKSDDVHGVVGRIQQKAADILHGQLNLDTAITGACRPWRVGRGAAVPVRPSSRSSRGGGRGVRRRRGVPEIPREFAGTSSQRSLG